MHHIHSHNKSCRLKVTNHICLFSNLVQKSIVINYNRVIDYYTFFHMATNIQLIN